MWKRRAPKSGDRLCPLCGYYGHSGNMTKHFRSAHASSDPIKLSMKSSRIGPPRAVSRREWDAAQAGGTLEQLVLSKCGVVIFEGNVVESEDEDGTAIPISDEDDPQPRQEGKPATKNKNFIHLRCNNLSTYLLFTFFQPPELETSETRSCPLLMQNTL